MPNKTAITIDDIYRSLRVHDEEILKHFNDENLTDQNYLFYAISGDIISNALSIIIAIQTNNINSIGVDNNCRAIIEALVVLKMMSLGDISDEQAKIFRYHYAVVDYANMKKFINDKTKEHDDFKYVEKDRQKAFDAMMSFHNCRKKELMDDPDFDDPNFYLKKKLGKKYKFTELLEKYQIFDVGESRMYDLFSLYLHPRYEFDSEIESSLSKIREKYVYRVLDYVVKYLVDCKLMVFDDSINNFDQDFFKNPVLKNNVLNILDMLRLFDSIEKKTCYFDDGYDAFTIFFLNKMKEIIINMDVSISLGYKENIISMFKSTMEYIAMYVYISEAETIEEFKILKLAYCYSSRLQFNCLLEKMHLPRLFADETISELKMLFDKYYKEKYQIDDFDKFLKKVEYNARYFINKDKNNFNAIVNKVIDDIYDDPGEREFTRMIYKISKDMNHGGGYSFNSSPGLIDSQCRHVKYTIYKFMVDKLNRTVTTFAEHGKTVDLNIEIKFFEVLAEVEKTEIQKVDKEYADRNKKAIE